MFLPQTGRSQSAQRGELPSDKGQAWAPKVPALPHGLTLCHSRWGQHVPRRPPGPLWDPSPAFRLSLSGLHLRKRRIKGRPVVTCV